MTFAALQTIHSILENEKYKLEKYVEVSDWNYEQELEQMIQKYNGDEEKAYAAMVGRAVTANRDGNRHDLDKVTHALQEFESHEWR
jgi:hypothetical protein